MINEIILKVRKYVPSYWPLQSFIATNPLVSLVDKPLDECLSDLGKYIDVKGFLGLGYYHQYYLDGKITARDLDASIQEFLSDKKQNLNDKSELFRVLTDPIVQSDLEINFDKFNKEPSILFSQQFIKNKHNTENEDIKVILKAILQCENAIKQMHTKTLSENETNFEVVNISEIVNKIILSWSSKEKLVHYNLNANVKKINCYIPILAFTKAFIDLLDNAEQASKSSNSNKNIFYEQQMIAMQILDVHNPEIKKKLMKIGKKQIQGKRVLPGPDIIYTKETVIDCDPSYLKGKRERYSGYENSNYSYSKRNGYCDYNNNIAFDHHEEDIQTFNYECESYSKKSKKCKVEKFDTLINASNSTKMSISYFKPKDSSNEINDSSIVKNKRNSFETNKTETTNYTSTNYSEKPKILQDTNFSQLQTSKMKKLENTYNNTDSNKKINNDEYSERSESNKNCIK